jgi:hypothetical protein
MAGWFKTGYDGFEEAREEEQKNRAKPPQRVWMPPDKYREIIFVDDECIQFWEHQLYLNGTWQNWFTCLENIPPDENPEGCPLCDSGQKKYYVTMYTVIDATPWVDKKGNERKNVKRLLAVKTDVAKAIERSRQRRGSLEGCKYEFYRASETDASSGDIREFLGEVDLSADEFKYKDKQGKIWTPESYDYEKFFAPKSRSELLRILNAVRREESVFTNNENKKNSDKPVEDDIPF